MHEIITLQLGQASNYVATHFWNTQESYFTYGDDPSEPVVDSDIHWRAGVGADGSETFLPRTVIYDLKGGFGTLRKINALYEPEGGDDSDSIGSALTWAAKPIVHQLPSIPQSLYQQRLDAGEASPGLLPSDVRYWSDFSRVFYHPKSLNQMYDYELNSSIQPFEDWNLGRELFQSLDREEDMVDRDFRPFIEEADQMQAVQVFTCLDDAWGGFASDYIVRMRDEYPKATIWVWGVQTSRLPRARLPNRARSVASMCEQASMVVPLSIPDEPGLSSGTRLDSHSDWHTSALLSTALETAGFGSRATSEQSQQTLGDIASMLNLNGKQTLGRLQMSVTQAWTPKDADKNTRAVPKPRSAPDLDLFRLTGHLKTKSPRSVTESCFGQNRVSRATPPSQNNDSDEGGDGIPSRLIVKTPYPLLDSFPAIYFDHNGSSLEQSAGVDTRLSTDAAVSDAVKGLRSSTVPYTAVDEREDLGNALAELADSYRDGWSSGSDDDDD